MAKARPRVLVVDDQLAMAETLADGLSEHGYDVKRKDRFGEKLLSFQHPCGIEYELVGIADDDRKPYSNGVIPSEYGIRGTHGITVDVRDSENTDEFMHYGWSGQNRRTDGKHIRYEVGAGGSGAIIDFQASSQRSPRDGASSRS